MDKAEEIEWLYERVKFLGACWFETRRELERAYCAGEGYTEEYGWPVGDHIPSTMADSIIERMKR